MNRFEEIERSLTAVPGVQAVALSTSDPVQGYRRNPIALEGIAYPRPEDHPQAGSEVVASEFFRLLNLPLLLGRSFTANDAAGSTPVAIVNATFAKKFFPQDNPLGQQFREGTNAWLTIVGCVADLVYDATEDYHPPVYFRPAAQQSAGSMVISLRGSGRDRVPWNRRLRRRSHSGQARRQT